MRLAGIPRSWNDDRGFGFIAPTHGGAEIFVHISSFPSDGSRPVAGESITYEPRSSVAAFRCDGRTYCSQMTSCAEATWFLKNCPGVKMDGNHDGIPCEQQWCR